MTYDGSTLGLYANGKLVTHEPLPGGLHWPVQQPLCLGTNQALRTRLWCLSRTLVGSEYPFFSAIFSPNGTQIVTASEDHTAKLWDVRSGSLLHTLTGHSDEVISAVFSPDGTQIVTSSMDNTAKLWDTQSGALLHTLTGYSYTGLSAAVFSPQGTQIVTPSGYTAKLWDARSGHLLHTLTGHSDEVNSAVFSPNGTQIVTASDDHTAKLWDARSGIPLHTLRGHTGYVFSAVFNPDGTQIVTASADGTAKLWDARNGGPLYTLSHNSMVLSAVFSPSGALIVTVSKDNTAIVWDAGNGNPLHTLSHNDLVNSAVFSPSGALIVTASMDNTAKVWDARSGNLLYTLDHSARVTSAVFSPDGTQIVTAGWDGTAKVWDARSATLLHTLDHSTELFSAAFSPDGTQIVTASWDGTVKVWDARSATLRQTLYSDTYSAAFSPDSTQIVTSSSFDYRVIVWDARSGNLLHTLTGHSDAVYSAVFSPDGALIVTASDDHTAKVWDARSGTLRHTLTGHSAGLFSAVFSPNGTQIVTASLDDTAKVWDTGSGNLLHTLGHSDAVNSAVFSPHGTQIVTASDDHTAKVWDTGSGNLLQTLTGHSARVNSAVFSPDGTQIVTASYDNTARIWVLSSAFAGRMANLSLTIQTPPKAADIQTQVQRAILKTATGTIFPLEFSLENDQQQAVIYLGNVPKTLCLLVKNTGRRNILFAQNGPASSHFELHFRPGTLSSPENVAIAGDIKWPGWSLAYHQELDGTDVFAFQHLFDPHQANNTLIPSDSLQLKLAGIQADERGGARGTRVQLRYSLQYDDLSPIEGSRLHFLSILQMSESEIQANLNGIINQKIPDLDAKNAAQQVALTALWKDVKGLATITGELLQITAVPLVVWAEGSPFIINNGLTKNELYLQIGHIGGTTDDLQLHNSGGLQTTFILDFNLDKPWGLLGSGDLTGTKSMIDALVPVFKPPRTDWQISAASGISALEITYTGTDGKMLTAGEVLSLYLTFTCSLPPGHAFLVINYQNIGPGETDGKGHMTYPHGHLTLSLVRSPIAFQKHGINRTIVDGQLDLVNAPQIAMRSDNVWQIGDANLPDATLSVDSTKGLTIASAKGITLQGPVNAGALNVSGELNAGKQTINASEVNTIGITAGEYKLAGASPQLHDYGYVVPAGGIIIWSGSTNDIPQGWKLCDGNNGTPNLTNRFIVGAGGSYKPKDVGGQDTYSLTEDQLPAHSHSASATADPHAHAYYAVPPGGEGGAIPYSRLYLD